MRGIASIPFGNWTHVAATYDTKTMSIYFNGALDNKLHIDNERRRVGDSTTDFLIGAVSCDGADDAVSQNYQGLLDELSLYDRALSETEIRSIYEAGAAGKAKPIGAAKTE